MRSASQIKTAVIIAIVLLLGTNIMMHVAEARAKAKYNDNYRIVSPTLSYVFSYLFIVFAGFMYLSVNKNFDDEETKKMMIAIPGVGLLGMIAPIMELTGAVEKTSRPEGQMIVSALSIQIVVCLGFAGYIYSGMRN